MMVINYMTGETRKMSTSRRSNLPTPWPKPIDVVGKNIANLASAVGGVISGPTNTINPQRTPMGSREWDEWERLQRRGRVSPYRSRRLASMTLGNPEQAALPAGTRYPTGRQKSGRLLYTSLFTPERKSILAQGPLGIVKRVMTALGV